MTSNLKTFGSTNFKTFKKTLKLSPSSKTKKSPLKNKTSSLKTKISSPKTKKQNKATLKLKKLKTKKKTKLIPTVKETNTLISKIAKIKGLPSDIEKEIISHSKKKINPKLKKELLLYTKLSNISYIKNLNKNEKKNIFKFFKLLNPNHKKGFVLAFEKDLEIIHPDLFKWLIKNWNDCVLFIGNRKKTSEYIKHFFDVTYEKVPTKINIRSFIVEVNDYLITFDYE